MRDEPTGDGVIGWWNKRYIIYGYYRYQTDIMLVTVAFLVLIVQLFQEAGTWIVDRIDKRGA